MPSFAVLKNLYQRSPLCIQRAYAAIPFSLRAGRVYRRTRQMLANTEFLPAREIESLQQESLQRLLVHAYRNTIFYRNAFDQIGLDPRSDGFEESFTRLPLLDKPTIRANTKSLLANSISEPCYMDNTGGSSGTPMAFYKSNSMYPTELAYMFDQWNRIGYRPGARKLTLRGRAFPASSGAQKWLYNPIYNEVVLSSYHLDVETLRSAMPVITRFSPEFIHGYPSAIVQFLRCLKQSELPSLKGIKAVFCGSEPLYDFQREFINTTLNTRAYSWYGQSECILMAGECEHSRQYHSFPLYGKLELVDDEGKTISQPGVEGEIVGTSLTNYTMPFIRYRTGDRGIMADGVCKCGRSYPRLEKVTGRTQYYVYTSAMVPVPVTAFVFGQHFQAFERLREMQLTQDTPGEVVVRLVCDSAFSHSDEEEIRYKMQSSVDENINVRFEYYDSIPRNNAGKVDFVVQNISTDR